MSYDECVKKEAGKNCRLVYRNGIFETVCEERNPKPKPKNCGLEFKGGKLTPKPCGPESKPSKPEGEQECTLEFRAGKITRTCKPKSKEKRKNEYNWGNDGANGKKGATAKLGECAAKGKDGKRGKR